jgi:hypothetical protein
LLPSWAVRLAAAALAGRQAAATATGWLAGRRCPGRQVGRPPVPPGLAGCRRLGRQAGRPLHGQVDLLKQ